MLLHTNTLTHAYTHTRTMYIVLFSNGTHRPTYDDYSKRFVKLLEGNRNFTVPPVRLPVSCRAVSIGTLNIYIYVHKNRMPTTRERDGRTDGRSIRAGARERPNNMLIRLRGDDGTVTYPTLSQKMITERNALEKKCGGPTEPSRVAPPRGLMDFDQRFFALLSSYGFRLIFFFFWPSFQCLFRRFTLYSNYYYPSRRHYRPYASSTI